MLERAKEREKQGKPLFLRLMIESYPDNSNYCPSSLESALEGTRRQMHGFFFLSFVVAYADPSVTDLRRLSCPYPAQMASTSHRLHFLESFCYTIPIGNPAKLSVGMASFCSPSPFPQ